MRKKSMFSTVLGVLVLVVLGVGGYTFFKDLEGPIIEVSPSTGRVSPVSVLKISMQDVSGIRSVTVGVKKNNVLNVIFTKHFDQYLPERTVEVSFKDANLREGAFDLEIRATDGSLAGFGQGNTRTLQLPMRLDTQPPRISVKTLPPNVRRGGAAVVRYTIDKDVTSSGVLVGSALNTQSQTLTNSGLLQGEASLTVNTQRLDNQQNGTLYSAADLTLDIPDIRNSGLITGDNGLMLNAVSLSNPGKIIADTLSVRATTLDGDGLLQGLQRGKEWDHRGTVVFFPMLQIQRAIFDNLLAIGCPARHPDGGLQQRAEKCRTMGGLSRRFFQQGF